MNKTCWKILLLGGMVLLGFVTLTQAETLQIPYAFGPGQIISSSETNWNNAAIEQAVNHIDDDQINSISASKFIGLSITHALLGPQCVWANNLYSNIAYNPGSAGGPKGGLMQQSTSDLQPGSLYVNTDNFTVEVSNNKIRFASTAADSTGGLRIYTGHALGIADLGVVTGFLADASVTKPKLAPGAVDASTIANYTITLDKLDPTISIPPSYINFSPNVGYKTATDDYWSITGADAAWHQLKVEDHWQGGTLPYGQDIVVNVQVIMEVTGPVGAVLQIALSPYDAAPDALLQDHVSCPMALFTVPSAAVGSVTGASVVPVPAIWIGTTPGHYFMYMARASAVPTGGNCYLSALSWSATMPYGPTPLPTPTPTATPTQTPAPTPSPTPTP